MVSVYFWGLACCAKEIRCGIGLCFLHCFTFFFYFSLIGLGIFPANRYICLLEGQP